MKWGVFICFEMIQFVPCNSLVVTQQGSIQAGQGCLKRLFNDVPPLSWDICSVCFFFLILVCRLAVGGWYLDSALETKNLLKLCFGWRSALQLLWFLCCRKCCVLPGSCQSWQHSVHVICTFICWHLFWGCVGQAKTWILSSSFCLITCANQSHA